MITELERRFIVEAIEQAIAEIDDTEAYVSEKVIDDLNQCLQILGVTPDETDD